MKTKITQDTIHMLRIGCPIQVDWTRAFPKIFVDVYLTELLRHFYPAEDDPIYKYLIRILI